MDRWILYYLLQSQILTLLYITGHTSLARFTDETVRGDAKRPAPPQDRDTQKE